MTLMGFATPAKGVGRESVARVQIPRSPPKKPEQFVPVFLFSSRDLNGSGHLLLCWRTIHLGKFEGNLAGAACEKIDIKKGRP